MGSGVERTVLALLVASLWSCDGSTYANIEDGRNGLAFIDACIKSNEADGAWAKLA